MNFVLEEDTETLDEVVVVGYGVQRKRDLSGSIASVKGDIITEYANTSVASALQDACQAYRFSKLMASREPEYK